MDHKEGYQKALERAKKGLPIDEVFPELKESEDERIMRCIEVALTDVNEQRFKDFGTTLKECISYLEKQKEQKSAESTALHKAFISSKIDYTLEEKCDASDYADAILPTSVACGENDEEYKLHKIIEAAFIAGQKKEQKPVEWSEEDELMRTTVIQTLEKFGGRGTTGMQINWLKCLPERFIHAKQVQSDDVCSVIKEYYGKELPFEDERTKAAYHLFSAGRTFELKKIEEERVKHITDLLDNYQKGKKAGYKEAISELKEEKIECSPVMKELIDKLFGIGNAFNFGFGPKDFSQEQLEMDLEKEYAEFVEADPVYSKLVNGIVGRAIARHFYELSKARKDK